MSYYFMGEKKIMGCEQFNSGLISSTATKHTNFHALRAKNIQFSLFPQLIVTALK